jgi:chromosome segregation ATPase
MSPPVFVADVPKERIPRDDAARVAAVAEEAALVAAESRRAAQSVVDSHSGDRIHLPPMRTQTDDSLRRYQEKLIEIEGFLFERLLLIQRHSDDLDTREEEQRKAQSELAQRIDDFNAKALAFQRQSSQHDVEIAETRAKLKGDVERNETTSERLAEWQRTLESREKTYFASDVRLQSFERELTAREAMLSSQQQLLEQEKGLCKKLSAEILRRESTVRSVEKNLNAARHDLQRLEDDVTARAKRLVEDEESLRRWATDLERRELSLRSVMEQLRNKGIAVSLK